MLSFSLLSFNVSSFIRFQLKRLEMYFRTLVIVKNGKGNNSVITRDNAIVLAVTEPLIALFQCIKFYLIPFNTSRDMLRKTLSLQKKNTGREITR